MEAFRYLTGVSTLELDLEACIGCGACETVCPHGVMRMNGKKARIVDRDGCMECGACATNCPTRAVSVTPGVGCAAYIVQTWFKGKKNTPATCC